MPTVILARHGRTLANVTGVLAGRSPGVNLDDHGVTQARQASARLAGVPLATVVSSPLERCHQTARLLVVGRGMKVRTDERLNECDYGDWTGGKLKDLAQEPLWKSVQRQPSGVRFPGGEAMAEMSARAVTAVRELDAEVAEQHGDHAIWLLVSHGDVIKALLADALGMHLDSFQRIVVDPASMSVVRYTSHRPYVLGMNTTAGPLDHLVVAPREKPDETLGGGGGAGEPASENG